MFNICQGKALRNSDSSVAKRKLSMACFLVVIFIIGEVVGGIMSGSLAIMSDAAHMFSGLTCL